MGTLKWRSGKSVLGTEYNVNMDAKRKRSPVAWLSLWMKGVVKGRSQRNLWCTKWNLWQPGSNFQGKWLSTYWRGNCESAGPEALRSWTGRSPEVSFFLPFRDKTDPARSTLLYRVKACHNIPHNIWTGCFPNHSWGRAELVWLQYFEWVPLNLLNRPTF